jgi:hypothetical protein
MVIFETWSFGPMVQANCCVHVLLALCNASIAITMVLASHYHKSTSPFHLWFWFLKTKPNCGGVVHIIDHCNCHLWFKYVFQYLKFIIMLCSMFISWLSYWSWSLWSILCNINPSPLFFFHVLGHLFYYWHVKNTTP